MRVEVGSTGTVVLGNCCRECLTHISRLFEFLHDKSLYTGRNPRGVGINCLLALEREAWHNVVDIFVPTIAAVLSISVYSRCSAVARLIFASGCCISLLESVHAGNSSSFACSCSFSSSSSVSGLKWIKNNCSRKFTFCPHPIFDSLFLNGDGRIWKNSSQ